MEPVADVVTFVPPAKVRVPELVMLLVDPLSLEAPMLVTVPLLSASIVTVVPETEVETPVPPV